MAAVDSLLASRIPTEVVIADNGLPPETAADLRARSTTVVVMGSNLGFGAAINRAARGAAGDVLVTLNDDVHPAADFVEQLTAPFAHGSDVVAGVLLDEKQPGLIETAGIEIDAALSPYDYLQGEPVARLEDPLAAPFAPCGGAAAFRRSVFVDAEGFDDGFFAYGEDLDLAIRLRHAGAQFALAPAARALHASSSTLGYQSLAKATLVGYSRGYLLRKYGVLSRPRTAVRAVGAETAASLVLLSRHHSFAPARARVRGWRSCRVSAAPPPASAATVDLFDGLRRRYVRSNRGRPSAVS
jgi:N-acetylglucosaminyl-diphospho-decaprenol L-rhamnosyltransferase